MTDKTKEAPKGAQKPHSDDPLKRQMEGDYAEAFRFENPGDMLVGKVVGFSKGFSEYGPHPVVTIKSEDDGEQYSVHCMQTVLRNQMSEADPKPGDRIAVKYLGDSEAKSGKRAGKAYKDFKVRVHAPNRSFADVLGDIAAREDDDDMPFT